MNPKVIFVGLHNKPGMKPLDSQSKSGKLIEKIAGRLRHNGVEVLKTNLFDVDYVPPTKEEKHELAFDWIERVELFMGDTVVLLGQMVRDNFPDIPHIKLLKVAHPASKRSHKEMDEYVEKTFLAIDAGKHIK